MLYVKITHTSQGNPRYLLECPIKTSLPEAKKAIGCQIATDNQMISIINSKKNQRINLWLIVCSYHIEDVIRYLESKYTFESDL